MNRVRHCWPGFADLRRCYSFLNRTRCYWRLAACSRPWRYCLTADRPRPRLIPAPVSQPLAPVRELPPAGAPWRRRCPERRTEKRPCSRRSPMRQRRRMCRTPPACLPGRPLPWTLTPHPPRNQRVNALAPTRVGPRAPPWRQRCQRSRQRCPLPGSRADRCRPALPRHPAGTRHHHPTAPRPGGGSGLRHTNQPRPRPAASPIDAPSPFSLITGARPALC